MSTSLWAHLHICQICDAAFDCVREGCVNTLAVHCAACEPQTQTCAEQVAQHA